MFEVTVRQRASAFDPDHALYFNQVDLPNAEVTVTAKKLLLNPLLFCFSKFAYSLWNLYGVLRPVRFVYALWKFYGVLRPFELMIEDRV